jgi:hypothetical protein
MTNSPSWEFFNSLLEVSPSCFGVAPHLIPAVYEDAQPVHASFIYMPEKSLIVYFSENQAKIGAWRAEGCFAGD